MASYTPNLNLYKPDDSDDYKDFREGFNDNMDILDQGGGGGGDSVQYVQVLDHGTRVGQIVINGTSQDINAPTVTFQANFVNGDYVGGLKVDEVMYQLYSRQYLGGDGVEVGVTPTGPGRISLEYLTVIDGVVNLVFDDGN